MRRSHSPSRGSSGFTLLEMVIAMGVMLVLLAVVASASMTLKKGIEGTTRYVADFNNGNRLIDYVAQDLRRAVRVGQLSGGVNTPLKTGANNNINETNTLTINLPDFYSSNTPSRALGAAYKTPRNIMGTPVAWTDAVNSSTLTVRYAPAASASDEIQIRYFRAPRSGSSNTSCYFRGEYSATSGTALSPAVEIAESVADTASTTVLLISAYSNGTMFHVESHFTPRFRLSGALPAGTNQLVEVTVHNARRD